VTARQVPKKCPSRLKKKEGNGPAGVKRERGEGTFVGGEKGEMSYIIPFRTSLKKEIT